MVELVGVDIKLCEYATFNFRGHRPLKWGQRVKGASLTNVNGKFEMSMVKLMGIDTKLERIWEFQFQGSQAPKQGSKGQGCKIDKYKW
jgi:hypothetical protein